jgi:hypothetical protein
MLSMAHPFEIGCIWLSVWILAFSPDALKGVKASDWGRVPRESSPAVNPPNYRTGRRRGATEKRLGPVCCSASFKEFAFSI